MPLNYSPAQFSQRAHFYRQLEQLTSAGVPIDNGLKQLEKHPPARCYRKPAGIILSEIRNGSTLTEAARVSNFFPPLDLSMIEAGERSGRLDASLELLGNYYQSRAEVTRILIASLAYPVLLLHVALVVLRIPALFQTGDWVGFFRGIAMILVPLYAVTAVGIWMAQSRHSESWRAVMEQLLEGVPVLGKARGELAIARLSMALGSLLSSGVTVIEAWQMAAEASGSPGIARIVRRWLPALRDRATPSEMVQKARRFPELFASQYAVGEISGKLDQVLMQMHKYYNEAGTRKIRTLATVFPWIVYAAVAGYIIYNIFQFYLGYFQQIQNVL